MNAISILYLKRKRMTSRSLALKAASCLIWVSSLFIIISSVSE